MDELDSFIECVLDFYSSVVVVLQNFRADELNTQSGPVWCLAGVAQFLYSSKKMSSWTETRCLNLSNHLT
jgi:hypothetical protein